MCVHMYLEITCLHIKSSRMHVLNSMIQYFDLIYGLEESKTVGIWVL